MKKHIICCTIYILAFITGQPARALAFAENLQLGTDPILIDNYKPYLKQLELKNGTETIYKGYWEENSGNISFVQQTAKFAGLNEAISITATVSEPMQHLRINSPRLGAEQTMQASADGIQFSFTIPASKTGNASGLIEEVLSFTGLDISGNPLLDFSNRNTNYSLPYRTGETTWANHEAYTEGAADVCHRFFIGNCTSEPNCQTANFTINGDYSDEQTIALGTPLLMVSASSGIPTAYAWDFGNGANSTEAQPTKINYAEGTYNVSLTLTYESGYSQTVRKTINIKKAEVIEAEQWDKETPTAQFSPTASITIQAGDSIRFTDTSTGIHSRSWAFTGGEPATSALQSPYITYAQAGTYSVSLTIRNSTGEDTHTETALVQVVPNSGIESRIETGNSNPSGSNSTVNFSAQLSGGTAPYSYSWDFGDGSTSTGQQPAHDYTNTGTYTVKLTVTDTNGAKTYAHTQITSSDVQGWVSADGCSTGSIQTGACNLPLAETNQLENPLFENTNGYTIDPFGVATCEREFPFGQTPKAVEGQWYASHGAPVFGANYSEEDSKVLVLGARSEYIGGKLIKKSTGLYYQMPQTLNPGQVYTLRFAVDGLGYPGTFESWDNWGLDKLNVCLASGLQEYAFRPETCESDPNNKNGINEFLPDYPFTLHKLGEFNYFGDDWACAEVYFTVPQHGQFDQLFIYPESVGGPAIFTEGAFYNDFAFLDNFELTSTDYNPQEILLTDNERLSGTISASGVIMVGQGTTVRAGSKLNLIAGDYIDIEDGFDVEEGAEFSAEIATAKKEYVDDVCQCAQNDFAARQHFFKATQATKSGNIGKVPSPELIKVIRNGQLGSDLSLQLSPNPTRGIVNLFIENGDSENYSVELLDISGRQLLRKPSLSGAKQELDLRGFNAGLYFVKVGLGGKSFLEKLVLQ